MSVARISAANLLLEELKGKSSLSGLVTAMGTLLQAYINLAMASTKKFIEANRTQDIGFRDLVAKPGAKGSTNSTNQGSNQSTRVAFHDCLKHVQLSESKEGGRSMYSSMPHVLTKLPPVRRDACYDRQVVRISKFFPTFSITDTGISRPKIIVCEGTDGVQYKQLVKGGDDMRQDAILEQVFEVNNLLFRQNREINRRNIRIRTYHIIPLSPQTGVLEWVENTIPFGSYLCDKDKTLGAHSRYHPSDWTHYKCREVLKDAKDRAEKEEAFATICANFQPVFRYFFLENYVDPLSWISNRTSYTRSVAVTSMIGYILGIGDRHAHNILVDLVTAEVVHIDFGIMFEQGKLLHVPETVPFRLTRDIVDGMGLCGCEGTFRRCCEEVLKELKNNTSKLLTILEVVIYDPLYKWSLSPIEARKKQELITADMDDSEKGMLLKDRRKDFKTGSLKEKTAPRGSNEGHVHNDGLEDALNLNRNSSSQDAAARALLRIKDKLQGYEITTVGSLSIEGQVNFIVNEARSASNLCALYPGWAPWL